MFVSWQQEDKGIILTLNDHFPRRYWDMGQVSLSWFLTAARHFFNEEELSLSRFKILDYKSDFYCLSSGDQRELPPSLVAQCLRSRRCAVLNKRITSSTIISCPEPALALSSGTDNGQLRNPLLTKYLILNQLVVTGYLLVLWGNKKIKYRPSSFRTFLDRGFRWLIYTRATAV